MPLVLKFSNHKMNQLNQCSAAFSFFEMTTKTWIFKHVAIDRGTGRANANLAKVRLLSPTRLCCQHEFSQGPLLGNALPVTTI